MILEQLRVFVAIAEYQHVTRAAAALNLAQSAASAAIAALEGRHGTKLFNRVGRGIELTEAGSVFLQEARAILARVESAELVLSELAGLTRGTLVVQASQTIAGYWLPRHLVAFHRAHPGINIKLGVGNTAEVAQAVDKGIAELGFVEGETDLPSLTSRRVAGDHMMIVVGPDHPWVDRASLAAHDLFSSEWVLREPGSGTRSAFITALRALGVTPDSLRVVLELPTNEAVRAAVEAGLGATAISASVATPSLEAGLLHRVGLELPSRDFHVLFHRERHRSRSVDALIEMVCGGRTLGHE